MLAFHKIQIGGKYLKDAVYAASDGIVTTFAVVASVVGAALDPVIILIIGLANLLADGFSMAAGNYLGSKSEAALYHEEYRKKEEEIKRAPESERQEIEKLLLARGFKGEQLETMLNSMMQNKAFAVDFLLGEGKGLTKPEEGHEKRAAIVTLIFFLVVGAAPLLPYVLLSGSGHQFLYAVIFTSLTLFIVGAARVIYTGGRWILGGLEMLLIGGIAAVIAYGIGFVLRQLVNGIM